MIQTVVADVAAFVVAPVVSFVTVHYLLAISLVQVAMFGFLVWSLARRAGSR